MNNNEIKSYSSSLIDSINETISEMKDGERETLPNFAEKVAVKTDLTADQMLAYIKIMAPKMTGVVISAGRNGGLYKGFKPSRKSKTTVVHTGSPITDEINGQDLAENNNEIPNIVA